MNVFDPSFILESGSMSENILPLPNQISEHFGDQVQVSYVSRLPGEIVIDFRVV